MDRIRYIILQHSPYTSTDLDSVLDSVLCVGQCVGQCVGTKLRKECGGLTVGLLVLCHSTLTLEVLQRQQRIKFAYC